MKFTATLLALLPTAFAASHSARTTPQFITIKNFTRTLVDPTSAFYEFIIDYQFSTQYCTIWDSAPTVATHSWYGVPCEENHTWEASWGWSLDGNFTVLTVVDEPNQYEAFFGYKDPNAATSYPDQGPNAVQHT